MAEEIAQIYKLRWDIEKFFGWWKRHMKVYHIIARSRHGLMVQILAGLITYILLALYFRIRHNEKVSIQRVRQLRSEIRNGYVFEKETQTTRIDSPVASGGGVNSGISIKINVTIQFKT